MFCDAVAACAGIVPTAVSVVSCHEKTGKRLLAIALQLTVEIQVCLRCWTTPYIVRPALQHRIFVWKD